LVIWIVRPISYEGMVSRHPIYLQRNQVVRTTITKPLETYPAGHIGHNIDFLKNRIRK